MSLDSREFVDLDRYPIDAPGPARDALVEGMRAELEAYGCAVLKGFVRRDRLSDLVTECDRVAVHGHRNFNRTNPYFTQDHPDLAVSHPLRRFYDRSNAFVPADNLGPDSILRTIFEMAAFAPFVQAALGETRFYPYADPLADVIVNLAEAGNGFPGTSTPTTTPSPWPFRTQSPAATSNTARICARRPTRTIPVSRRCSTATTG